MTYTSPPQRPRPAKVLLVAAVVVFALPPAGGVASPFGVNAHIPLPGVLDEVARGGVGWIRIDMLWSLVEPEPDVFDWSVYDELVDEARARDLRILATVGATPLWASDGPADTGVPRDPADWWDFCFRAAIRYRGRVEAWGLWNEPNLERFWSGSRSEYIEVIVATGADAVHAADPRAVVCAPTTSHLGSAHWDDWLRDVLDAESDRIDVVTHNVYPDGTSASSVTAKLESGSSFPDSQPSVREVLASARWLGRPFWLSETGAESLPDGEGAQEAFYTNLLSAWFGEERGHTWIDRVFFYEMVDDPRFYPDITYGLLSPPPWLRRKRAFYAYRDFIGEALVDDAEVVQLSPPDVVLPKTPFEVVLEVRNTGTTTWTAADGYRPDIRTSFAGWTVETTGLASGARVPPRTSVRYVVRLTPPGRVQPLPPKTYVLTWRMKRDDGVVFGLPRRTEITVSRDPAPEFVLEPQTITAAAGGAVTLRAEAAAFETVEYRWQRNGMDLVDGDRYQGTASPVLTISALGPDVTGWYRCVATAAETSAATAWAGVHLVAGGGESRRGRQRVLPEPPSASDDDGWRAIARHLSGRR